MIVPILLITKKSNSPPPWKQRQSDTKNRQCVGDASLACVVNMVTLNICRYQYRQAGHDYCTAFGIVVSIT